MKEVMTSEEREQVVKALRTRILNVLPAASYQMDRFLKMADVVVSDRTETACMEIGPQPRLHLNAKFVETRCKRDEHLLLLILHELYHVILGHTRLFPRLTPAHNIAFDAVINSMLSQQFRESIYLEFFQKLNPWSQFPARLLRPPPGWPDKSKPAPVNATPQERAVIKTLYGERSQTVTYHEILELLKVQLKSEDAPGCILLGDHGGQSMGGESDEPAVRDGVFKQILGQVLEGWPRKAIQGLGRGSEGNILDYLLPKPRSPRLEFLEALKRLIKRAGVLRPDSRNPYAWQKMQYGRDALTSIPNCRDRQCFSKEIILGEAPLLYKTEIPVKRARWTPRHTAHLYIDISGSMANNLSWLMGAIEPLLHRGLCRLYAFSTVVDEVRKSQLFSNRVKNTLGTDINCVYRHLLEFPLRRTPKKVVVLTDGYVGVPETQLHKEWERRKVDLYFGIVGEYYHHDLKPFAKIVELLPRLH